MSVTFAVNVLVLLYNVYMKRLENQGKDERVKRIDKVLDWAYPLLYIGLIGVVARAVLLNLNSQAHLLEGAHEDT